MCRKKKNPHRPVVRGKRLHAVYKHWRHDPNELTFQSNRATPDEYASLRRVLTANRSIYAFKGQICKHFSKSDSQFTPGERGGATLCMLFDDSRKLVAAGVALCSPSDTFVYSVGRRIALQRATKQAGMTTAGRIKKWLAQNLPGLGIK